MHTSSFAQNNFRILINSRSPRTRRRERVISKRIRFSAAPSFRHGLHVNNTPSLLFHSPLLLSLLGLFLGLQSRVSRPPPHPRFQDLGFLSPTYSFPANRNGGGDGEPLRSPRRLRPRRSLRPHRRAAEEGGEGGGASSGQEGCRLRPALHQLVGQAALQTSSPS